MKPMLVKILECYDVKVRKPDGTDGKVEKTRPLGETTFEPCGNPDVDRRSAEAKVAEYTGRKLRSLNQTGPSSFVAYVRSR